MNAADRQIIERALLELIGQREACLRMIHATDAERELYQMHIRDAKAALETIA